MQMGNRKNTGKVEGHPRDPHVPQSQSNQTIGENIHELPGHHDSDMTVIDVVASVTTDGASLSIEPTAADGPNLPNDQKRGLKEREKKDDVEKGKNILMAKRTDSNANETNAHAPKNGQSVNSSAKRGNSENKHVTGNSSRVTEDDQESVRGDHIEAVSSDIKRRRHEHGQPSEHQLPQQAQFQHLTLKQHQIHQHQQLQNQHQQQNKFNHYYPNQQQQQQQQQYAQVSQFLLNPNNQLSLSANRQQQQQQQQQHQQQHGLISLPAIPSPCYVHQQTNGSSLHTLAVDFLQPSNHHPIFPITGATHQVIGQMPTIHFPAIATNQQQHQNSVVPPQNTQGVQHQQTASSTLPSASFTNFDQQQLICNNLNQHQQHQQSIMQHIDWQLQLQKSHFRQQQHQLQNPRRNIQQQQQQQLLHLQNNTIFYQPPLKPRQIQQQHNNHHHNQHHHQQQQQNHIQNISQTRQQQQQQQHHQQQNPKVDMFEPTLDASLEKNNMFQNGPRVQGLHQQQQPNLQSLQLQIPLQLKKQHKQEQHQVPQPQQQPSTVSIPEKQVTATHIPGIVLTNTNTLSITTPTTTTNTATTVNAGTSANNQGVNLYVKHLDGDIDDNALKKMFSRFGEVVSAKVMMEGQISRGFGFVCFARAEDAARATRDIRRKSDDLSSMKNLYVAPAQRKEERQAIFREKLRSFMEDTPASALENDAKKLNTQTPAATERINTIKTNEGPVPNIMKTFPFDGNPDMTPMGDGGSSFNAFSKNSKVKTNLSFQSSNTKSPRVHASPENTNKPGIPFYKSLSPSSLPGCRSSKNDHRRQQKRIKNIFDLDNFSLENLTMPLLKTAAAPTFSISRKHLQDPDAMSQEESTHESQAEPIPDWFFETDEDEDDDDDEAGDVSCGNLCFSKEADTLDDGMPSRCFPSLENQNIESSEWRGYSKLCGNFDVTEGAGQTNLPINCHNLKNTRIARHLNLETLKEVSGQNDQITYTDFFHPRSRSLDIWNCKLITKEDNEILDGEEERTFLENKENCQESPDLCKELVKDCISCCTDTDSSISCDEDNEHEYKNNTKQNIKCKSSYRKNYSKQNGQNNNSNVHEDDGSFNSRRATKRRRRDSSLSGLTHKLTMRIHFDTSKSNTATHCQIVVASATRDNKVQVLGVPVRQMAETHPRETTDVSLSTSRKRKWESTLSSAEEKVEEIACKKIKGIKKRAGNFVWNSNASLVMIG